MRLSIITINWNNAQGLKKTLDSVAAQRCRDFELIIVDGASTDGSVEIIKDYANRLEIGDWRLEKFKWVSEKDTGIYNAMNKGIRMAHGEYLLFLNSGDAFADENVVENFYKADISEDIATGIEKRPNGKLSYPKQGNELTYSYFYDDTLLHQSTFIRRDAFERYGMYNENNRIVSDWEWFFRVIIVENATYRSLDFVVADFDGEGLSTSSKYKSLLEEEGEKVHNALLPRLRPDYFELKRLQNVEREYKFLKNGKFGWIVRLLLKLKKRSKRK